MSERAQSPSEQAFRQLVEALEGEPSPLDEAQAHLDPTRASRKGVPEIVYAERKTREQVIAIVRAMIVETGRVIVSRLEPEMIADLREAVPECAVEYRSEGRTALVIRPGVERARSGGKVAILTAGTSDLGIADEARIVAQEMGCDVEMVTDLGVAGLHRLFGPLRRILDNGVDAFIVVAGMDGALPSVVAGLVPVPVVGLPTSVGYGHGGAGEAALMSMLQTCAPGLTVVNIDNGVGAGASAAMIANAVAAARAKRS